MKILFASLFVKWIIKQISTQWIAIITAIAGFIAWKQNHSKLIVQTDKETQQISEIGLDNGNSIVNDKSSTQYLPVWLINPSENDVSFFDLRITLNTHETFYYTKRTFNSQNNLKGIEPESVIPFTSSGRSNEAFSIVIPQANYGTVQSHGFVQLDLIFHTDKKCDNGLVLMKFAQPHNLFGRLRHSHLVPKWIRPKRGFVFSETKEVALPFRVKEVSELRPQDNIHP